MHDDLLTALGLSRDGVVEHDLLASIYNQGKLALLVSWQDVTAARQVDAGESQGIDSCGIAGYGSCVTTACSIVARHRSSILMRRDARPRMRNRHTAADPIEMRSFE